MPVEEPVSARQFRSPLLDARTLCHSNLEAIEVFSVGNVGFRPLRFGREVCSDEQIGAQILSLSGVVHARGVPSGGLAFDIGDRVLRHGIDVGRGNRYFDQAVFVEQAAQHGIANLAVPLLYCTAGGFVIARQVLVSLSGDTGCDHLGIEQTNQTIAELDVSVEEGKRLPGLDGLDPERGLAQLHRERVPVHAMDTVLHDLAQSVLPHGLVGGVHPSLDAGDLGCHAACRCQKKVSRAARRVEHLEIKDGFAGIGWAANNRLGEDGLKRRLNELVHQRRRRVVGPSQLSLGALGLLAVVLAGKAERPRCGIQVNVRLQFQ